jgi:hypothetical protein
MSISTSNPDLMRAILAMDAYNRGYNAGVKSPNAPLNEGLTGTQIGLATIGLRKGDLEAQAASFFAQAYTLGGQTVISYRGTDATWDAASGWVNGGGAAVTTADNSPSSPTPPSSCRETANLSPGLDRGVRLMCTDRVVPNH